MYPVCTFLRALARANDNTNGCVPPNKALEPTAAQPGELRAGRIGRRLTPGPFRRRKVRQRIRVLEHQQP
jgi:hypothetical protein